MIGPVFVVLLSVVAAVAVAWVLLRSHTPDGGYLVWVREAFSAVRGTAVREVSGSTSDRGSDADHSGFDTGRGLHVADILAMSEQGPAYQEAVDLRRFAHRPRATR